MRSIRDIFGFPHGALEVYLFILTANLSFTGDKITKRGIANNP
jgi:hypothetical protein